MASLSYTRKTVMTNIHEDSPSVAPSWADAPMVSTQSCAAVASAGQPKLRKKKKLLNGLHISLTFPSGAKYEGRVKDGRLDGYGIYTYARTGDVYKGEWKADLKHGHGTYTFANKDQYIGQWYMGKRHGKGRLLFDNGNEYVGSWRNDQMNGYGVFSLASNGDRYEGYWNEGVRHGQGSLLYGNGDLYDGEWLHGHQQGLGVFCQSNNELYCGYWSDGVMDGKGVLREKGIVFLAEHVGGYLISKVRLSEASDEMDEEWNATHHYYLEWVKLHKTDCASKMTTEEQEKLKAELEAAQGENAILRERLEDLLTLYGPNRQDTGKESGVLGTSEDDLAERVASLHWRDSFDKVQHVVKLLECTLGERVVECRKLTEQLKKSEGKLRALELKGHSSKPSLRRMRSLQRGEASPEEQQDSKTSSTETAHIDIDEVHCLRQQNASLLEKNEALHNKVAFLSAENADLTVSQEAAENQYQKLMEELSEMREKMEAGDQPVKGKRAADVETEVVDNKVALMTDPGIQPLPLDSSCSERNLEIENIHEKLLKSNQLNIELRFQNGQLERRLQTKTVGAETVSRSQEVSALEDENQVLRSLVTNLKAELAAAQKIANDADMTVALSQQRQTDLEDMIQSVTERKAADPQLQESLARKSDQILTLSLENARLARLLEETRANLEETVANAQSPLDRTSGDASGVDPTAKLLSAAQKEVRRLQRRLKKATTLRGEVAEQLYQSQIHIKRTERTLRALQGEVIVFVSLADMGGGDAPMSDIVVKVDASDARKLTLSDCGIDKVHQYNHCFASDSTVDDVYSELCNQLPYIWWGHQFALVTLGEHHSGKSTLVKGLLPLLVRSLSKAAQDDPKHHFFSFTYRVAVVEICANGGWDCASDEAITEVCSDSHGFAQPRGAHFIDCTSGSITAVAENLLAKRRQHYNGRCHTWIQVQCVRTGVVRQHQTVGRLTIFDWCGEGPVASQKTDIESARFANASGQLLREISTSLSQGLPEVLYDKTMETSLLFDLLGGNSITTVIGHVRRTAEHVEETLRTLSVLTSLSNVRNGPLLPDTQTSDEIRWRGIVAALSSDHQAEKEWKPIENNREF